MVQLKILSGKKAGTFWGARHFPIRIGRSCKADLQLEEDGIWEEHLRLDFEPGHGFFLTAQPKAFASVNGQPVEHTLLQNGDSIEVGSSKIQFWLSETRQAALGFREWLTWTAIAVLSLGQVSLIYLLLRL